jgi:hypothetical protein
MNSTNNQYCENTMIINNKEYKLEKIWRLTKYDMSRDAKGELFPYPKEGPPSIFPESKDIIHRLHVMNTHLDAKKKYENYDEPRNCHLCDKKNVSKRRYMYESLMWEDGLIHYIDAHNVKPSIQFTDFVLRSSFAKSLMAISEKNTNLHIARNKKINNENISETMKLSRVTRDNKEYVIIEKNQILILDALMIHGGYKKKYTDVEKTLSRYSEHAGFLDFEDNALSKIVVSGRTNRVDDGDNEIYLPLGMEDMLDYEYIFHTHPPTPRPGGRSRDGILYEIPSIGDIYHFIDHHNDGNVIGSLVVCAEGLYNIRKTIDDPKNIIIDEDNLYKKYHKIFNKVQKQSITEYGTNFTTQTFYSKIAQNTKYIEMMNKVLNTFDIQIDYYPRKKDSEGMWIIDTVFLVFRHNKTKK